MSNNRTPLLLGAMIFVVVVWVADSQFDAFSAIDNWGKESEAKLAKLDSDIGKLEDLILRGADATDKLLDYEQRALPYQADMARSNYQAWLVQLVSANGLLQSSVEVGSPSAITVKDGTKKTEAFKLFGFSVAATGTLEQVSKFMYDFYRGGHLQKITSVSLNKASGGRFALSVNGEAISLRTGDRKTELSQLAGQRLEKSRFADYSAIVRRDMFTREVGVALKQVRLSSVTYDRSGVPEAWFKVGVTQSTRQLQRGDSMSVSVHEIEVVDIQPRSVLVQLDGELLDLPVGKSLFEIVSLPEVVAR